MKAKNQIPPKAKAKAKKKTPGSGLWRVEMTKAFVLSLFVLFLPREAAQYPVPEHVVPTGPQSEMNMI